MNATEATGLPAPPAGEVLEAAAGSAAGELPGAEPVESVVIVAAEEVPEGEPDAEEPAEKIPEGEPDADEPAEEIAEDASVEPVALEVAAQPPDADTVERVVDEDLMALHLAAIQRMHDEAVAGIDHLFRGWRRRLALQPMATAAADACDPDATTEAVPVGRVRPSLWPVQLPATRGACPRCPLLLPCDEHATVVDERFGIWGSPPAEERRRALRRATA